MDLVVYDETVHALEDEIDTLLEQIFDIEEELKKIAVLLESDRTNVRELKKIVDAHELQMKVLDEKMRAAKSKLSTASTGREYELLKKEFDASSHEQNLFEDTLLTAWSTFENAQKLLVQKESAHQEKIAQSQQALAEKNAKKDALQVALTEKNGHRLEKQQGLPEKWIADYERMRGTVKNPVVPLENGSCSACFESLAGHQITELARKQLAPCGGCFRFLFIKP
jgi:predicted  nucleic acid-binding Zn-ribbon protein